jgi:hypothetical protein
MPEINNAQQHQEFVNLLAQLGQASLSEIEITLAKREPVEPETELTKEIVNQFHKLLRDES